jgi:hypothetical protein
VKNSDPISWEPPLLACLLKRLKVDRFIDEKHCSGFLGTGRKLGCLVAIVVCFFFFFCGYKNGLKVERCEVV